MLPRLLSSLSTAALRPPAVLPSLAYRCPRRFQSVNWSNVINQGISANKDQRIKTVTPVDPNKMTPQEKWTQKSLNAFAFDNPKEAEPASPYAGRTVEVRGSDVAGAWNLLHRRLRFNNVMMELRQQRRHEKRGYKRRRLRSERWRMRFADEVRKKIRLVQIIRHRGG